MKHIARMLIVLIGLGALTLGMTMLGSAPAYTQQGAPTFDVNVANPASSPVLVREVDNPGRHAFQRSLSCDDAPGAPAECFTFFTVPASQLLVIETVTAKARVIAGEKLILRVHTTVGPETGRFHYIKLVLHGTDGFGSSVFIAAESVRLYADPSSAVSVTLQNVDFGGGSIVRLDDFVLSGYLVDCGAGSGCPLP